MKKILLWITLAAMSLGLFVACQAEAGASAPSASVSGTESKTDETPKILYLCGDLSQDNLSYVSLALRQSCEELGLESAVVDCKGREDVFSMMLDELVNLRPAALLVTTLNEGIGPLIYQRCEELSIPLLSVYSRLKNPEGQMIPYIGPPLQACGIEGGRALADLAEQRGFLADDRSLLILRLNMSSQFFISQTASGYQDALLTGLAGVGNESYVTLEATQQGVEAQYLMLRSYFANSVPDARFLCAAFNDEGAAAFFRFTKEMGIAPEDVLVCSVGGGQVAYDLFAEEQTASSYLCIAVDPFALGTLAAETLHSLLIEGVSPATTQTVAYSVITSAESEAYFTRIYGEPPFAA